ncbi:ribonuclease II [Planomonospora sphaerica]|uniref:Ribonuclease II n=1 Tax=Planomonospora sphaerica TaxID=161355 RepID=A0A171CWD7_9ACTN|nr:putative dsRNA-binding protein [Planomonospora sphaerica]GAT67322.1 ribonuclease II [Planomonospora sphaerica]
MATAAASAGERPTSEHHPIIVLNEQAQQGRIGPLEWQVVSTGPSHAPAFTATVVTRPTGGKQVVMTSGTGASKAVARAAAAAALDTG